MARNIRSTELETRARRLRLPIAKKPRFVKIGRGVHLGYRRNASAGAWVVRCLANGRDWTQAIGTADDFEDANGATVLTYWEAQNRARTLAPRGRQDGSKLATVADALDSYESDLQTRGGDAHNVRRVRLHLPPQLARANVALVTSKDLRTWRDALAKRMAPASVNRTTSALKAALNLAADHDERITSRRAW